jgi:hypothetical protein
MIVNINPTEELRNWELNILEVQDGIGTYDRLEFEIADVLKLRRFEEFEQEVREAEVMGASIAERVLQCLEDNIECWTESRNANELNADDADFNGRIGRIVGEANWRIKEMEDIFIVGASAARC